MSQDASTHTEIYRTFDGQLQRHPLRFLSITRSHLSIALKKKRGLFLLYTIPTIMAIVYSFLVHLRYSAEAGVIPGVDGVTAVIAAQAIAGIDLGVSAQIVKFMLQTQAFALLAVAWYGAGLIAEDRRLGAHLLYFSRPITRLDYMLGKACTAAAFGSFATLFPVLLVLLVATFSSPDWSFIKQEWDVILKSLAYCAMWITLLTGLVLMMSSIATRKTLALAAIFGLAMLSQAVGHVLYKITDDGRYLLLSIFEVFRRIASWMFDRRVQFDVPIDLCFYVSGGLLLVCILVTTYRVRSMEVVA